VVAVSLVREDNVLNKLKMYYKKIRKMYYKYEKCI
jgi:hypothetical protein